MHSRLIALAVGLLAVPLALAATPGTASSQASLFPVAALPGTLSEGGDQGSQRDRTMSPADTSGETPNLGK